MTGQNSNISNEFFFDPYHSALVPFYIAQDLSLNATQIRIYIYIVGLKFRLENVYITNKMLCKQLGIKEESKKLQKYMREMKEKGYLSKEKKLITLPDGKQIEAWCWDVGRPVIMPAAKHTEPDNSKEEELSTNEKCEDNLSTESVEGGVLNGHEGGVPNGHLNNKNKKEDKKRSKDFSSQNQKYSPEFLEFWECTNKKGSKWNAYKAWRSLKLDKRLDELKELWDIFYKNDFSNRKHNFRPNISTWLNSHPWDNEKIPTLPASQNISKTQNKALRNDFCFNPDTERTYEEKKRSDAIKDAQAFSTISEAVLKSFTSKEKSLENINKIKNLLKGIYK